MNITRRDLEHAWDVATSVHRDLSGHKGMIKATAGAVATQAESGLAAFGYGYVEGKYGPVKVGPLDADFLAALVLHGIGISGFAGEYGGHLNNFATGLLDGYLHRLGVGMGAMSKPAKAGPVGRLGTRYGDFNHTIGRTNPAYGDFNHRVGKATPMSDAEIAALMMSAR